MMHLSWATKNRRRGALLSMLLVSVLVLAACTTAVAFGGPRQGSEAVDSCASPGVSALVALCDLQVALEDLYQKVSPSVVGIKTTYESTSPGPNSRSRTTPGVDPAPSYPAQMRSQSIGSGFVWDTAGHIVTNNHVVDSADRISVTFGDGYVASATLVGADRDVDLAVIKVQVPNGKLKPIAVGDSTQSQAGQLAIVIGNPYGLRGSMSMGVISAVGRSLGVASSQPLPGGYTNPVIQTDAPINPGNSGGVLVDVQGRLIGVTSAIIFNSGVNSGIGFAIPSAIVGKVAPAIIEDGGYQHPWLGASLTTLTPGMAKGMGLGEEQRGALVTDVAPGGPAEKGGLRGGDRIETADDMNAKIGGDLIVAVNGVPVLEHGNVIGYIATQTDVWQSITLTVLRGGKEVNLKVTLEPRPAV